MKRKILQKAMQIMANYIVYMLENAYSNEMFYYYFEMGAKLDAYATMQHEIYLD
jgi:hypothetical protein